MGSKSITMPFDPAESPENTFPETSPPPKKQRQRQPFEQITMKQLSFGSPSNDSKKNRSRVPSFEDELLKLKSIKISKKPQKAKKPKRDMKRILVRIFVYAMRLRLDAMYTKYLKSATFVNATSLSYIPPLFSGPLPQKKKALENADPSEKKELPKKTEPKLVQFDKSIFRFEEKTGADNLTRTYYFVLGWRMATQYEIDLFHYRSYNKGKENAPSISTLTQHRAKIFYKTWCAIIDKYSSKIVESI